MQRDGFEDPELNPRPDLILLDLHLPKLDGLEVLTAIKSSTDLRSIPVVILTTSNSDEDMEEAYQRHANSYIVKPLDYDSFCTLIRDLGQYWLSWNQAPTYS